MLRIALATTLMLVSAGAYAQFNKCGPGFCPNAIFAMGFRPFSAGIPAATGKILLVDGSSFLLQIDGVSKICRAGGC